MNNSVTHSLLMNLLAIVLISLISGLPQALAHYFPWKQWFDVTLEKPYTYVVGVTCMLAPVSALYGYWSAFPPPGEPFIWAIAALLADMGVSGFVVGVVYHFDDFSFLKIKVKASELEAFRHGERSDDE